MLNPGYPPPMGVRLHLAGGIVVAAVVRFVDVILDAGVPTPRFEASLPQDMDVANYKIAAITAGFWPPGTIIMLEQVGMAAENAQRIVEGSIREEFNQITMSRRDEKS